MLMGHFSDEQQAAGYSLCCIIVTVVFSFGLAITEAVVLSESTDAKRECGPAIWYCVLGCSILHFIGGFAGIIGSCLNEDARGKANGLATASIAIAIWAMICYYDTSNECVETFEKSHADLWKMIFIEVVLFYVVCALFGLSIILTSVYCCIGCMISSSNTQEDKQEDKQVAPAQAIV